MIAAGPIDVDSPDAPKTILVVEDEVLIRFAVADYLRACGYQVLEAANADEAVVLLDAADMKIDLVFSDVQMPGTRDGFGLARWIRSKRPGVRVMLTSGADRSAEIAGELCDMGPVEPKPYDHKKLLQRIRSLLAQSNDG